MDNASFLIKALNTRAYGLRDFLISLFSVTEYPVFEDTKDSDLYEMQLVRSNTAPNDLFFINNIETQELIKLDEYVENQPLMRYLKKIELKKGDLVNVDRDLTTTYGNCVFNQLCLVHAFGDKIPFMTGQINPGKIESMIAQNLYDTPKEDEPRDKDKFYVDELIKHANAVIMLEALNFTCVPTTSEQTMLPNPAVIKRREELLKIHAHELDSPAVIAKIQEELVKLDKEYFKGTRAEKFYISGKAYNVSRMKKFGLMGLIGGIGNVKPALVTTSLSEGWKREFLPNYIDDIRGGSYARGKSTAIAGYGVKLAYNAFQSTTITNEDCGSTVGITEYITEDNYGSFINRYKLVGGKPVLITADTARENIGKTITIRTPMLCKNTPPSKCAVCAGKTISRLPNSVHITASDVNSIYMNITMKSMHGKSLSTKRYSILNDIQMEK